MFDGGGTPYEVLVITEQLLVGVKGGRLSGSGGMVAEGHTLNTQTTISAFGFGKLTIILVDDAITSAHVTYSRWTRDKILIITEQLLVGVARCC